MNSTDDVLVVLCTCPNVAEADTIAREIVERRLAACVTALPGVRSTYGWQDKVENAEEVLLLIKTTRAAFEALRQFISAAHSYATPEILALPVVGALDCYADWVRGCVKPESTS